MYNFFIILSCLSNNRIFHVKIFLQLYNEDIIDLLSHERSPIGLRIHEDAKGEIFLNGVTRVTVTSPSQV